MVPLVINPAFKSLIPPLSDEELRGLEESILSQGCRDAIKVWRGIIIDGHNRYGICQKHGIPYRVQQLRFSSKENATLWIIENQLGRRNLTDATRIKLALERADMLLESPRQSRSKSRKCIANESRTSEQKVYRYMRIQKQGTPELLEQVDKGELTIGQAYCKLNVTIKTVEVLRENDSPPDLKNPSYVKALGDNVDIIMGLYRFIYDKAAYAGEDEGVGDICRRLSGQMKAALGVCAWVGGGSISI